MALPRAFLSFDFDHDVIQKILFAGQAKNDSPTPFAVEDWSSKTSLPQSEWERLIRAKISNCHMLIVLVGEYMTSATGVSKEIQMAKDCQLPLFGVYVGSAGTTSSLPEGLGRSSVVMWQWTSIARMVNQCSKMGKNAKTDGWAGL